MTINSLWIAEEIKILDREEIALNTITDSLHATTKEIDALISQIRDNLAKRRTAHSMNDWPAYMALRASSADSFDRLDWLVSNL